jgi:hypothetical protein
MHYSVRKESTYNLPRRIIGDRKGSFDEWVVWVEYADGYDHEKNEIALKFFFDVEHEADWYKRDLDHLISTVLKFEHERIEKKFKSWLLSHERR